LDCHASVFFEAPGDDADIVNAYGLELGDRLSDEYIHVNNDEDLARLPDGWSDIPGTGFGENDGFACTGWSANACPCV